MRKILMVLLALAFVSTNGMTKEVNKEATLATLKSDLNEYGEAYKNGNVDKLMDYVYPGLFKLMPKDQMTAMTKQMFESDKAPKVKSYTIKSISDIKKFSKGNYATVKYNMDMAMKLGKMPDDAQEKMAEMMKAQMGSSAKITLDKNSSTLNINKDTEMLAIKEGGDSWKFIDKEQLPALVESKIIPAELAK